MNKSNLLLSAAALFASVNGAMAQDTGSNPWGINDGKMLGDTAPYSTWSINPYQAADGSAKCIAGYTEDDRSRGSDYSFRIEADLSKADIYMGFTPANGAVDVVTMPSLMVGANDTNQADIYTIRAERVTGINLMFDDPEAAISAVANIGGNFSEISYYTEAFPRAALLDCDARAKRGGFDAQFTKYDDDVIAVIDLGTDAKKISNNFTRTVQGTDQMATARGHIEYLSHYAPISLVAVFGNGDFSANDFLKRSGGLYSRSQSLTQGELISPLEGHTERACTTSEIEDNKLIIRQCLNIS